MIDDPKSPHRLLRALASAGWTDLAMSGILLALFDAARRSAALSDALDPYAVDLTMTEAVAVVFVYPVSLMIGLGNTVRKEDRRLHAGLSWILALSLAFLFIYPSLISGDIFWAASLLVLGAHRAWAHRRAGVPQAWATAVRLGLAFVVLFGFLFGAHAIEARRGVEWPRTLALLGAAAAYYLFQGLYDPARILLGGGERLSRRKDR